MVNTAQRYLGLIIFTLTCLISAQSLAAELRSSVDRTSLSVNETLTLSVRFEGQAFSEPEFSSLNKDFDILSQQKNNQLSYTNGNRTSYTIWSIRLLAKRTGTLLIPSFNLKGAVSNAVEIKVTTAPKNQPNSQQPLFIETSVDKTSVYVQEQLILTHKLYTRINLSGVASDELTIENATLIKIAENQYQKNIKGTNHLVVETKYAIFPQANGTLVIPALRYSITVPDERDRFSSSFFSRGGRQVFLRSDAKNIKVQPRPANIAMTEWLPSKGISLTQKWSRPLNEVRVGEPITRTINIVAQGLNAIQLPPLEIPTGEGFKLYPDQAQMSDEQNGSGVIGKRTESIAIVPTQPGEIQLPPVTLIWWNTQSNQRRATTLEAQTLQVLPAEITTPLPTIVDSNLLPTAKAEPPITNQRLLMALIASNGILLIILVGLLFQNNRLRKLPKTIEPETALDQTEPQLFKTLRLAANETNYSDFQLALISWARIFWQDSGISTLEQVTKQAGSPELTTQLTEIDKCAYSTNKAPLDFIPTFKVIIEVRKQTSSSKKDSKKHLEPLYGQ